MSIIKQISYRRPVDGGAQGGWSSPYRQVPTKLLKSFLFSVYSDIPVLGCRDNQGKYHTQTCQHRVESQELPTLGLRESRAGWRAWCGRTNTSLDGPRGLQSPHGTWKSYSQNIKLTTKSYHSTRNKVVQYLNSTKQSLIHMTVDKRHVLTF